MFFTTVDNTHLKLVFLVLASSFYFAEANSNGTQVSKCGISKHSNDFSWADYLVLGTMLVVSCGIGFFYGYIGPKQSTSNDFLLGGSSMGTLPMAMSLAASFVTAIELLGNPAEMFNHGTQFLMICCAFILVVPLTSHFYLPLFMSLRLTSTYEYLSLRFASNVRYFAGGLYILQMVFYTSVAVYAPALALSHVTGLNVYLAVTVVYVVCIFYASQGGIKAVIIADTFQSAVLLGSILLILFLGERLVGGTKIIWSQNYNRNRLEIFNLDANPTVRHSFWSVVVGGTFYWLTMFCSNQASIQKYLSVQSIKQVRKALWTSCFGLILVYVVNFYTGMILVAHYKDCDLIESGEIHAADQILPYYVLSELGNLKGVTGFFVAGIFAASLGTVASALNSLAAVTIEDFVVGVFKMNLHESRVAFWAKCISAIYGALSFVLVFVIAQLGSVMQVAISFNGMVGGVTLGLFSLGMFFPWANARGAIFGSVLATCLITIMCVGQQIAIVTDENFSNEAESDTSESVFFLFRISYIWYSALGFLITVVVGFGASYISGFNDPNTLDWNLLSPPVRKYLLSLSDRTKKRLNIPLKLKNKTMGNTSSGLFTINLEENCVKGVDDLDLDDNCKQNVRKNSTPSSS